MRSALPRPGGGRRRAATAVVGLASAALALLGLQLPAATTASAAPAERTDVVRQCADAAPGEFACLALRRTDVPARAGLQPLVTPDGFGPADLRSAYALPADGGAGQTVAVVAAYDNPAAEVDLGVYRQQYGLPECTTANGCFTKVSQRGGTDYPAPDENWAGEISLDVDMVSAIAPKANILLVEADSASFEDIGAAVDQAVALGAKYVSNSYGTAYDTTPGSGEDPSEVTALDPHYNHPGVAMVASSGDSGYGVTYPAASQYVTSVGGTALTRDTATGRGWTESVWNNAYGGPGSGCSLHEPKPAFQTGTLCGDKRAVADVAAVADPVTGVSVYQTYGGSGWAVYGGTSASAPIIAGVYAAAGAPVAGTYPNGYPYAKPGALNDVTQGGNGSCATAALCTAGPGYDGPTGLGTPNGITAFRSGPHGVITGTVTDHATGGPIGGATVKAGDHSATTDATGGYRLDIPAGTYDITAGAYGYTSGTATGVVLADGATVTEAFALDSVPTSTVTGKITDGSGHGWPLYATVTADGVPGGPVFTDPVTGVYTLTLPQNAAYTLRVAANYPGYQTVDKAVRVTTANATVNVAVPVDAKAAQAPGYAVHLNGPTEPFTATTGPPDTWSVVNAAGTTGGWTFNDPGKRGNRTGGSGGFAIVDSDNIGRTLSQNTTLLSPSYDLSAATSPQLGFDTDYKGFSNSVADVDVSSDGGATWTNLWHKTTTSVVGPVHVDLPLTGQAGKSDVRLRFHYTGTWAYWWQLDNIFVGQRSYDPVPGGLVVGNVTDANTLTGVNGATVISTDAPADRTTTAATPDDPNLGDGFYWAFSHLTGKHPLTATASRYTAATATANIAPDGAAGRDLSLKAGQLKVTPASIAKTVAWGGTATQTVTVKNTGTAPATLTLGETPGGAVVQQAGAPLNLVPGHYSPLSLAADGAKTGAVSPAGRATAGAAAAAQGTAGTAWQAVPDLPVATGDNAVATYQGTVYSAYGYVGSADTGNLYAYSAESGAWTKLAPAADTREAPAHGIINGKFYAAGGWGASGAPDAKLEIYDIASNTWTTGRNSPKPYAGSGSAVLDGKLYSVGGCTATVCGTTDVTAYDPATDTWSNAAAYPEPISWESCGAIAGKLDRSGGTTDDGSTEHAYVYDPATDAWSPVADQPTDAWGASYTAANGLLLVKGGAVNEGAALTNQTWAYRPADNTWTALPNANASLYRGGGGTGFYAVGGLAGQTPAKTSEVLTGYDETEATDVSWLSASTGTVTVAAGASTTLTVTLDASVAEITQPGTLTASLSLTSDTPYTLNPIGVSLTVKPPTTWGKITGTVKGATTGGGSAPIAGATVQINSWAAHYTLKTAADGTYALWLDVRNNPLQLIVAKDGWQPAAVTVKIVKGATTTKDFTLLKG